MYYEKSMLYVPALWGIQNEILYSRSSLHQNKTPKKKVNIFSSLITYVKLFQSVFNSPGILLKSFVLWTGIYTSNQDFAKKSIFFSLILTVKYC